MYKKMAEIFYCRPVGFDDTWYSGHHDTGLFYFNKTDQILHRSPLILRGFYIFSAF